MKNLFLAVICLIVLGCSTTSSDVRDVLDDSDRDELKSIAMNIDSQDMLLSSQGDSRIFKLHQNAAQVHKLVDNIAKQFGAEIVDLADAQYLLKLESALPDGGACLAGAASAAKGLSG